MTAPRPAESKHLFSYELKGEPNEAARMVAEIDYPELSLDGEWNPAAYREFVTNMMNETYDADPSYRASLAQCEKQELVVAPAHGNDASVRIWCYRPHALKGDPAPAAIVYAHGGGSVGGCLEDFDAYLAQMAVRSGTVVFGVGHRLVPTTQYPHTVLDVYVGARHVLENAAALGVDPERIALSGDSAGGYQVLATTAKLAQDGLAHRVKLARICVAQIFDYFFTESPEAMPPPEAATVQESHQVIEWMVGDEAERHLRERNPLLFPGLVSDELLAQYPPFIVIEQEFDNFRTPNERLAERLRKAGRLLEYICYPGCPHDGGHPHTASDFEKMIEVYLK